MQTSTLGVSLVQSLSERIIIGATPKFVRGGVTNTFDLDAGVMVSMRKFRLGMVARNLTTPTFAKATAGRPGDDVRIELGREVRVGGAWGSGWTGVSRVIVAVDADVKARPTATGERRDITGGVESWWFNQRFGLRGGLSRSTIGDARPTMAAGISAGLSPGMLLEAHVMRGEAESRSWSIGARVFF